MTGDRTPRRCTSCDRRLIPGRTCRCIHDPSEPVAALRPILPRGLTRTHELDPQLAEAYESMCSDGAL